MPVIDCKIVGEEDAMKVAFEKIMIDGSNRAEIVKLVQRYVTAGCENKASVAEVLVVDAMLEKRIQTAERWLKENNYNEWGARFALVKKFASGQTFNRGVLGSIIKESMLRIKKEATV